MMTLPEESHGICLQVICFWSECLGLKVRAYVVPESSKNDEVGHVAYKYIHTGWRESVAL